MGIQSSIEGRMEMNSKLMMWSSGCRFYRVPRRVWYAVLVLVVMLGALAALAASPAHATTVKGTFHYKDTNPDTDEVTDRPIINAKVEIWRFRSRCFLCPWTWGKDRETTTDANGSISVDMP